MTIASEELDKLAKSAALLSVIAAQPESPYFQQMAEAFSALQALMVGQPVQLVNLQLPRVGTDADLLEKDLASYSLPALALDADAQAVRVRCWGSWAVGAATDTRRIRLYFGAAAVLDINLAQPDSTGWRIEAVIGRTGAASQNTWGEGVVGRDPLVDVGVRVVLDATAAEDLSAAITVKVSGQNLVTGAANTIVCNGFAVELLK